jgi:hypothetical protein
MRDSHPGRLDEAAREWVNDGARAFITMPVTSSVGCVAVAANNAVSFNPTANVHSRRNFSRPCEGAAARHRRSPGMKHVRADAQFSRLSIAVAWRTRASSIAGRSVKQVW